ncbi:MAG TPA: gliding motility-associated C-terminal domain-containing protein [Vicingus sp.]|nr:gliding motility-associated C-terminal domain-containing protein [Vicingus sp.]
MKYFILYITLFCTFHSSAQLVFYQDVFYGGVTGGGFSSGAGSGTVISNLFIPFGSSIKKAYLIAARDSSTHPFTVSLNGNNYSFNETTMITYGFLSTIEGSIIWDFSSIHAIDITKDIDSSIISYSLLIPPQINGYKGTYSHFYLYIVYKNILLPKVSCGVFINTQNVSPTTTYNLSNLIPINNNKPIGLSLLTSHFCDTIQDGSYVAVNGNTLGLLGGSDANSSSWFCTGTYSNFAHYNDSLFGLDDDTPDSLMAGTDALADIKSYVNNGDTSVDITFTYQSNFSPLSNPIRAVMLSYSTLCDTFTTTATANQDTVCAGEPVQLNATGGASYSWYSPFSTFNDSTLANPVATPTQTTTYIVTIKNDSGCVKTEHVKVWVNPTPKPDTITTSPQRCGSANGSIVVGNIPKGTPPFTYSLTNLQTLATSNQQLATFNSLLAGDYLINITDSNGCVWQSDTLVVAEIHDITANFNLYTLPLVFPTPNPLGTAPLTVYTQNSSVNANSYEWTISQQSSVGSLQIKDTIIQHSIVNTQHSFEEGGTFEVCLLAYNNIVTCGDTMCKTIFIAPAPDSLVLVVPNVFSPNNDGSNDNFVLQVQSANLLSNIEVEIFNRWGQTVESRKWKVESSQNSSHTTYYTLWDGTTNAGKIVPEGTYFYVIHYTKLTGEMESLKGSVSLLR